MDNVYQAALAERNTLRKQQESIEERLEEIEEFLSLYSTFAAKLAPKEKNASGKVQQKSQIQDIAAAAVDLLADGKPRHTRVLVEQLRTLRGIEVPGKDESARVVNLSQILGRVRDRTGSLKVSRATGWAIKAPKSKGPVNAVTLTGPDLAG